MQLSKIVHLVVFYLTPFYLNDRIDLLTVGFESWDLQLIIGLVVLISTCRYVLLRIWPDFRDSSEAANRQVSIIQKWGNFILFRSLIDAHFILFFRF